MKLLSFYKQLPKLKRDAITAHAITAVKCVMLLASPVIIAYHLKNLSHARTQRIQSDLESNAYHGKVTISPELDVAGWDNFEMYSEKTGYFRSLQTVSPIHPMPDELSLFRNLQKNWYNWPCKDSEDMTYSESSALRKLRERPPINNLVGPQKGESYTSVYDACKEQLAKGKVNEEESMLSHLALSQINKRDEIKAIERASLPSSDSDVSAYDLPYSRSLLPQFYPRI